MSPSTSEIYVWAWLPGETEPVPAGVLVGRDQMRFMYGNRYLERPDAVSLSPTLPLSTEAFEAVGQMALPSAIRDAAPDAWGRRVILNRMNGARGSDADTGDLHERVYLMESSSDRIGALDFQSTPVEYVARGAQENPSLPTLLELAELVSAGESIPEPLRDEVLSGTGIGGAKPKALVRLAGVPTMVKFSVSTDVFPAVEAEALASKLAERAGVMTPRAEAHMVGGCYALATERFDRSSGDRTRRMVVSGLTLVNIDELYAQHSSYPELAAQVRAFSAHPETVGPEVFRRIAYNIMISNNDDHLRNHSAFWDGAHLQLTPAYDLAPAARCEGAEMYLTLPYNDGGMKLGNLASLIESSHFYDLNRIEAFHIIDRMRGVIEDELDDAADEMQIASAVLATVRTSFLHESILRDLRRP